MLSYSDKFFGEDSHLRRCLFGLRRVPLAALIRLYDEVSGLIFKGFEILEIAIKFACVGSEKTVAFSLLIEPYQQLV